jgi:hypothetical protein
VDGETRESLGGGSKDRLLISSGRPSRLLVESREESKTRCPNADLPTTFGSTSAINKQLAHHCTQGARKR